MDVPDNSGLFQHQSTHSGLSPHRTAEFVESFHGSPVLGDTRETVMN